MKISCCLVLLMLAAIALNAQPNPQYPKKEQRKSFYIELGKKYSSPSIREIFNYDSEWLFENYIEGHSEMELVQSYSTVIHELMHGYNNGENGGYFYFIEPSVRIFVPCGKYYKSTELNSIVRKGQQDSIFRYALYVGGNQIIPGSASKNHGGKATNIAEDGFSIVRGMYGLVEEFSAYYFGALATYELYPYYLNSFEKGNKNALKDYKGEILSDILAYHEFKLFFGWYLSYAQQKHPDIHQDMFANKALRAVFTLMESKFELLQTKVEAQLLEINQNGGAEFFDILDMSGSDDDIIRLLVYSGMEPSTVYKEEKKFIDGKFVIEKTILLDAAYLKQVKSEYMKMVNELNGGNNGDMTYYFAQPLRQIAYLKRQFSSAMGAQIDKFRLDGITTANYQQFLK